MQGLLRKAVSAPAMAQEIDFDVDDGLDYGVSYDFDDDQDLYLG